MPTALPDCPRPGCDAANTLTAIRVEPHGVRVCECSCCNAIVRVNVDGAVIHAARGSDVSGVPMFDP